VEIDVEYLTYKASSMLLKTWNSLMYGHVEVQFDVKIMSVNRKAMEKK
jgi:hypothetical protein